MKIKAILKIFYGMTFPNIFLTYCYQDYIYTFHY